MTMSRTVVAATCVLVLAACAAGCGTSEPVRAEKAWARPAQTGGTTAAYFDLVNGGPDTLHVTGVAGEAAEMVQMHETVHEGGMASMREVSGFDVAPGATFHFEPGGNHIMLINVRRPLLPGLAVALTLHFSNHPDLVVEAAVKP